VLHKYIFIIRLRRGGSNAQPTGSVSLEVEIAGQRAKRIEEADQNLAKTRAEVADAERLTKARAKYAFYQAVYLRQRLELMQQIEDLNLRLRDASMVRFHAGETPKLEANLAVVRYDQSRRMTLLARRDYEDGLRALQRVLGMPPRGAVELTGLALGPCAGSGSGAGVAAHDVKSPRPARARL
jgi:outer membrane protein TolC